MLRKPFKILYNNYAFDIVDCHGEGGDFTIPVVVGIHAENQIFD